MVVSLNHDFFYHPIVVLGINWNPNSDRLSPNSSVLYYQECVYRKEVNKPLTSWFCVLNS